MDSSWQFQLSSHSIMLPRYSSPLFNSTVTMCPAASCSSFTGIPKLLLISLSHSKTLTLSFKTKTKTQTLTLSLSLCSCAPKTLVLLSFVLLPTWKKMNKKKKVRIEPLGLQLTGLNPARPISFIICDSLTLKKKTSFLFC